MSCSVGGRGLITGSSLLSGPLRIATHLADQPLRVLARRCAIVPKDALKTLNVGEREKVGMDVDLLRKFDPGSFKNLRHFRNRGGIKFKKAGNYLFDFFATHGIDIQFRFHCLG
jgi:hypothetical protein